MQTSTATDEPLGLRERKAAQTRLAIADSLRRRLVEADLRDISADELAADADISRMTVFNYFPAKRDAVDLLMVIHIFGIQVALHREGLRGVGAIERVFSMTADVVAEAPHRMRRIYALHLARPQGAPMPTLTRAEQQLLAPDAAGEIEVSSLGHLLVRLVDEAREDGLAIVGSSYELSHFLGGLLNGAALIGHSPEDNTDYKQLFRRHARRALGLLGVEGQRDPRPPRIPPKYRKKGSKTS